MWKCIENERVQTVGNAAWLRERSRLCTAFIACNQTVINGEAGQGYY